MKVVSPGSITIAGAIPPNRTIESHGVLNFGCSRRKTSGICR